jgi:predicted transcriptional regulator of viral defense system
MVAVDIVNALASRGQYHFTTGGLADAAGVSLTAARAALRRLKRKGVVAAPYRGFHVIVPPEYRRLGCLPADQFVPQLLEHLRLAGYAALLSAAAYHGASHQQPQVFQVMVRKNRPALSCGEVEVAFHARHNVDRIPTVRLNTPRGYVDVSTPEATAFDLVGYYPHAGGLDNVATLLPDLLEGSRPEALAAVAPLSPVPWAQRLGYLLALVGKDDHAAALDEFVSRHARETAVLYPARDHSTTIREPRWKLIINAKVEPDL